MPKGKQETQTAFLMRCNPKAFTKKTCLFSTKRALEKGVTNG